MKNAISRTDQVAAIDTQLLDLLDRVSAIVEASRPIEVVSGYRSPDAVAHLKPRVTLQ